MAGDASAYATLGLEPGADIATIERAYKRLIKLNHPDRQGGNAERAAEINRAYRELRGGPGSYEPLTLRNNEPPEITGNAWVRMAIVLVVGVGLFLPVNPVATYVRQLSTRSSGSLPSKRAVAAARPIDAMDQPLDAVAILGAVRQAVMNRRNQAELLVATRDCHRILRQSPTMAQLDRCAAFDDAVIQLQDRDPMWDRGPFSELSVTGRQWSGASALSNDYFAIDGRLDRIRMQVELALAPRMQPHPRSDENSN
jgi:DnaJ-like protein